MNPKQRQIVTLIFRMTPNGAEMQHPAIVLSDNELIDYQDGFTAVMLTSDEKWQYDDYTFEITNDMVVKAFSKRSFARLNLVSTFITSDIIPTVYDGNEIHEEHFKRLVMHISKLNFGVSLKQK